MNWKELKDFLDEKVDHYNRTEFIQSDPIQVVHQFETKEDREIIGFLAATIAWGQRKTIIANANKMAELLENEPYKFVLNHSDKDCEALYNFKHRTFNGEDFVYFIKALRHLYKDHGGLEQSFGNSGGIAEKINGFKRLFFELEHPDRTTKHVSDPIKGSSAKRINMYLRWMVRNDKRQVDLGIWQSLKPSELYCPLDVHSGNTARKLGLLVRKQNDWKAVVELTQNLRKMDPLDPIKYDFALFGLGVFERFS